LLEELDAALGELDQDDRALIDALFSKGMTERDYANKIHFTHLLRLGYIGPGYKADRKVLPAKLSGNSAFRGGNPAVQN